jgi:putative ABC transport system permease protein
MAAEFKSAWGLLMPIARCLTDLRHDAAYALRLLRRTPAFTAVAIATLALGIGASTAIFTIVDAVLLRPLRFPNPQRLAMIRPTSGSRVSAGYLHDWRLQSKALEDMAGWYDVRTSLIGRGEPLEIPADRVTVNFFALLGTPALMGRTFTVATSLAEVEPEVVVSYGFWQRRLGGNAGIIGQPITLDGEALTIIGVMPETFRIRTNELAESRAQVWIPLRLVPDNRVGMGGMLNVIARLAPVATFEQARTELNSIAQQIEAEHPSFTRNWRVDVVPLLDATVKDVRATLLVLFGAVGILLLIACANVATLVSSRAALRRGEIAIRMSLGATSGRLVRQLVTEGVVLATAAAALAVLVAVWSTGFLVSLFPAGLDMPRVAEIRIDIRVLGFAGCVTILTVVICGLLPAISSARLAPQSTLRDATRSAASGRNQIRVNNMLVVVEVALAVILLSGAGLLGRSFWELTRVDPGFRAEQVLTMRTTLPASSYESDDRIRAFSRALLERTANLPGVAAVGFANYLPMSDFGIGTTFEIEGRGKRRPDERPSSWLSVVGGRYFEAMGIPLVRGRLPGPADTERTPRVFVIDDALAHRYWPNEDPIGQRLIFERTEGPTLSGQIIGVVGSVRWAAMAQQPIATMYFWFPQDPGRDITIVARAAGDPVAIANVMRAHLQEIDPNQPVADIRGMQDFVSASVARPRFTTLVLASFATTALLLAALGLYGVMAFSVTQRTREIGVRVALGAQSRDVLGLIMRHGMRVLGLGLGIGILAGLALGRVLAGLLYGVTSRDPATLLASMLFLSAIGLLAAYLPARRATRVDPMVALRAE